MVKLAPLVFCSIFLTALIGFSPVQAGSAADPLGDLITPGANAPDIIGVSGNVSGSNLRVAVEFKPGTFLQPPGAGTTGVGIYLDTDINPATGGSGVSAGTVDFQTIGWEYLVVLQGANDSGIFRYVGPQNNNVTLAGIAPTTFTSDGFISTIPLSTLGPDDGTLTFKVASFKYIGDPGGPTSGIHDVAPNIGLPALGVFYGDYDSDGKVDFADHDLWQTNYGTTVAVPGTGADGSGDGIINAADYVVWRNANGSAAPDSPAASASAIPEPASVSLILLAGVAVYSLFERSAGCRDCATLRT